MTTLKVTGIRHGLECQLEISLDKAPMGHESAAVQQALHSYAAFLDMMAQEMAAAGFEAPKPITVSVPFGGNGGKRQNQKRIELDTTNKIGNFDVIRIYLPYNADKEAAGKYANEFKEVVRVATGVTPTLFTDKEKAKELGLKPFHWLLPNANGALDKLVPLPFFADFDKPGAK